jgi:DNA invertase Pin-like site-specific DNA recombinase
MKPVAIYVRSSKDLHNVSCEAQEEQIRRIIHENGEEVYRVFCDKALSSTRDVRPEFDAMISLAMSNASPFGKIYCLDTSRFGRDQHQTQVLLWQLRKKHGIEVVFVNMPQTGSCLDGVFETIMAAFDQLHSQQSKVRGVASMKQIGSLPGTNCVQPPQRTDKGRRQVFRLPSRTEMEAAGGAGD